MRSSLIHKNLVREISHFTDQNMSKLLQQKINPQPKLDLQLFRQKISCLKHTAAQNGLVSLSASQIKIKNRIFVIMKQPYLRYSQWTGYDDLFNAKKPQQCYDAIINPQLVGYSDYKIKGSQQCPSIQGMKFKVWIPLINKMKFTKYLQLTERKNNSAFKNCQQSLTGFYGRVFDHQYRHLQGVLVNAPQISNNEVYLTNDAMDDPQNFEELKNYRMEAKFFQDQNIDKYLEKEKNRIKQQQAKSSNPAAAFKKDFMNLPDQIDEKIKEKLKRSYEMVKAKTSQNSPFKTQKINMPVEKIQKSKSQKMQQKSKRHSKNKSEKK